MTDIVHEPRLGDSAGFRPDAIAGDTVFEVVNEPRDTRQLRTTLANVARVVAIDPKRRAIVILNRPKVGPALIHEEWEAAAKILKKSIYDRISLVVRTDRLLTTIDRPTRGNPTTLEPMTPHDHHNIQEVIDHVEGVRSRRQRRSHDAYYDVLRILLVRFFRREQPITAKQLGELASCSYPTVASAVLRLEPHLERASYRRIALRTFPRKNWFELISFSEKVRSTQRYVDRSSKPRSPELLTRRLQELRRSDVGIGGVPAARHYLPSLDLIGTPRLDLTVNTFDGIAPDTLVRRLDAALEPAERREAPQVVIHTINRRDSLFKRGKSGIMWSDEVECLLDLHEAHLEPQALEMLDALTPKP